MMEKRRVLLVLLWICILGWTPRFINGVTDPADAFALRVMYVALNSPTQLTQWSPSGDDPCGKNWKGITCSGSRVTAISLSGLGLFGSLGYQLGSLKSLTNLDLSNNNLGGNIPYQLPPNLQQLNLANNNYNGPVPYSISQMISLKYLNLAHNQLEGQINVVFTHLTSLSTMDLSFNALAGELPASFSSLSSLTNLYLPNNQFIGTINVLANLPLQNLNVANNRFTGSIPEQLRNINLQTDGNPWDTGDTPPSPPGSSKSGIGFGGIAGIVMSILVVGGILVCFLIKRKSRKPSSDLENLRNQDVTPLPLKEVHEMSSVQAAPVNNTKTFDTPTSMDLKHPPIDPLESCNDEEFLEAAVMKKKSSAAPINVTSFSIADLQVATGSFSVENLMGEGSFGRVYRAQFADRKVLAVKKIDTSTIRSELFEDFIEIVSDISRLHHPNVTELAGYCSEHGQHLLLYEFHKNGSLHDFLHLLDEYSKPLIWSSRVKIALGTSHALEYLHEVCAPSVVHKNIKSENILLDTELNPHLSDCGLGAFVQNDDLALNHNAGSGYSAPEVAMSGPYTLKSDVYSFGVVMLELLTGRKPFDSSRPRSEQSLVRWATPQLHDIDALRKMVDPALEGLYPVKSLSRFADVIALCVQPEPEFRPPMSEVVQALVQLVQRADMSKRTVGNDQGAVRRDLPDTSYY